MAFDTKHPEYLKTAAEWRLIEDALGGEAAVKAQNRAYLPMTAGMVNAAKTDSEGVEQMYAAYKMRAQYPEWVRDAVRSVMGMVSRLKGRLKIEYPPLAGMAFNASADGFPLQQIFLRAVSDIVKKGRFGLLCDIDSGGRPFIATYPAESIINWKYRPNADGRQDLSLLVLQEWVETDEDVFSHERKAEYLVYELAEGRCIAYRLNDGGQQVGEIQELSANNKPLTFIPFVFAGAVDNAPDVDIVPLVTMARSAVKYYQLSADYFQELHLTAHPQPVVTGQDMSEAGNLITGPMAAWNFPNPEAQAFYLEISGNGIEAKRQAMADQKNAALEAGARVMDIGRAESGEARLARQNDQYATLQGIVKNAAEAIEQCLRYFGEWLGLPPEQADDKLAFTVDSDFNKVVDTAMLQQLFAAAQMGMVSPETVWDYMQTGQIPERAWQDEHGRILGAGLNESETA